MVFCWYMNMCGALVLVALFLSSVFYSTPVLAQFNVDFGSMFGANTGQLSPIPSFGSVAPGVGGLFTQLSLIATPNYPEPHETFAVELSAPDENYSGALIKWYINGIEDLNARNKRQHTLTAGALGEKMNIRVTLEKQGGGIDETTLVIIPIKIDLVIEANTTVPSFYAGRALPSRGSKGRAVAVIHTGSNINRDNLTYRWELNGNVLEAGAIRGLSSVEFDMPLGFESYLDVTISDGNGTVGQKSVRMVPAEPQIIFYEENPLLGVNGEAFSRQKTVLGNQLTVRGEPYYINQYKNNPKALVEWSLGNRRTTNSNTAEPNVITLRSDGTTSQGNITLRMADLSKLSEATSNTFFLKFGF